MIPIGWEIPQLTVIWNNDKIIACETADVYFSWLMAFQRLFYASILKDIDLCVSEVK